MSSPLSSPGRDQLPERQSISSQASPQPELTNLLPYEPLSTQTLESSTQATCSQQPRQTMESSSQPTCSPLPTWLIRNMLLFSLPITVSTLPTDLLVQMMLVSYPPTRYRLPQDWLNWMLQYLYTDPEIPADLLTRIQFVIQQTCSQQSAGSSTQTMGSTFEQIHERIVLIIGAEAASSQLTFVDLPPDLIRDMVQLLFPPTRYRLPQDWINWMLQYLYTDPALPSDMLTQIQLSIQQTFSQQSAGSLTNMTMESSSQQSTCSQQASGAPTPTPQSARSTILVQRPPQELLQHSSSQHMSGCRLNSNFESQQQSQLAPQQPQQPQMVSHEQQQQNFLQEPSQHQQQPHMLYPLYIHC